MSNEFEECRCRAQAILGTGAPLSADITLTIEIAMGLALVLGMMLARRQRYRAHAWCQSTVVVLNLMVISQVMLPAFRSQVAPKIPARLARPYYALATGHAMTGCIAELLGLYIILVAGTRTLPKRLRFVRYKPWMRTELVIWWLALLLGLATYLRWYTALQRMSRPGADGMLRKTQRRGQYLVSRKNAADVLRRSRDLCFLKAIHRQKAK